MSTKYLLVIKFIWNNLIYIDYAGNEILNYEVSKNDVSIKIN